MYVSNVHAHKKTLLCKLLKVIVCGPRKTLKIYCILSSDITSYVRNCEILRLSPFELKQREFRTAIVSISVFFFE